MYEIDNIISKLFNNKYLNEDEKYIAECILDELCDLKGGAGPTIKELKDLIRQYNLENPKNKIRFSGLNKQQLLNKVEDYNLIKESPFENIEERNDFENIELNELKRLIKIYNLKQDLSGKEQFLKNYTKLSKKKIVDELKKNNFKLKDDHLYKSGNVLFESKNKKKQTKKSTKKEIDLGKPLKENEDIDLSAYNFLPKYKLIQYIEEFRPELPKKFFNKTRSDLVKYIKDYFKRDEIKGIDFFDKYLSPYKTVQFEKKLGLEKLKKGELTEQEKVEFDYSPYHLGTEPIIVGQEKVILQEHQKKFLEGFLIGNLRSAICFHGVGTGKTLTAVACAKFYLQLYPKNKVIIVTPTAVLFNFIESMALYGIDPRDTRYKYYSYDKYANSGITAENALLIVDEAHNFRTIMELTYDPKEKGKYVFGPTNKRGQKLLTKGGIPADKVLLLTATPFVNMPYDIENLLAIGGGMFPTKPKFFKMIASNKANLRDYFNYRISHFEKGTDNKFFPERREKYISFVVGNKDEEKIRARIEKKKNDFYGKSRQYSIDVDNKKFNYIIDVITKTNDKKFVIYVTFQESGVIPLSKLLNERNIEFGLISGRQTTLEKARSIDGYNNYENDKYLDKKNRILIITRAGAEGVNLKRTRGVFIVDGQWNDALYEQIIARAIRFKSHYDLPLNEQYVDVYKLFTCYDNEKKILDRLNKGKRFDFKRFLESINLFKAELRKQKAFTKGGNIVNVNNIDYDLPDEKVSQRGFIDYYLTNKKYDEFEKIYELREDKDLLNVYNEINKKLKPKMSMEDFIDLLDYINMSITALQSVDFVPDVLEMLKKGSYERNEYLSKQLKFGKDKHKYLTQDILKAVGVQELPSTDFYMFVLQKNKEKIINDFIDVIDNGTEQVEDSISKLKKNKKIYKLLTESKLSGEDLIKKIIEELRKNIGQSIEIIRENVLNGESLLDKFIQKSKELTKLKRDRLRAQVKQEFFTPMHYVEQLIEFSGIKYVKDKTKIRRILEPTAGYGNIVSGLLNVFNKNKIMMKIDMVEIVEENRQQLKKIEELIPDVVRLMEQPDFLKFETTEKFDYVFMNPPFHLQKRLNPELNRDYYDIDFVMRAYAMLENGGQLVAITGQSWRKMDNYKKWLESVNAQLINKTVTDWSGQGKFDVATDIKKLDLTFIHIRKDYYARELVKMLGDNKTILEMTRIPTEINKSLVEIPQPLTEHQANVELIERLEENEGQKDDKELLFDIQRVLDEEDEETALEIMRLLEKKPVTIEENT